MVDQPFQPIGRFIQQPMRRGNLVGDMSHLLRVVYAQDDSGQVSADMAEFCEELATSLLVNVVDAHVEAAYRQGRQEGYGEHHAVSDPSASIDSNNSSETAKENHL